MMQSTATINGNKKWQIYLLIVFIVTALKNAASCHTSRCICLWIYNMNFQKDSLVLFTKPGIVHAHSLAKSQHHAIEIR